MHSSGNVHKYNAYSAEHRNSSIFEVSDVSSTQTGTGRYINNQELHMSDMHESISTWHLATPEPERVTSFRPFSNIRHARPRLSHYYATNPHHFPSLSSPSSGIVPSTAHPLHHPYLISIILAVFVALGTFLLCPLDDQLAPRSSLSALELGAIAEVFPLAARSLEDEPYVLAGGGLSKGVETHCCGWGSVGKIEMINGGRLQQCGRKGTAVEVMVVGTVCVKDQATRGT